VAQRNGPGRVPHVRTGASLARTTLHVSARPRRGDPIRGSSLQVKRKRRSHARSHSRWRGGCAAGVRVGTVGRAPRCNPCPDCQASPWRNGGNSRLKSLSTPRTAAWIGSYAAGLSRSLQTKVGKSRMTSGVSEAFLSALIERSASPRVRDAQVCSSTTSPSATGWSRPTCCPSNPDAPHTRAYFSALARSLCTSRATSSTVTLGLVAQEQRGKAQREGILVDFRGRARRLASRFPPMGDSHAPVAEDGMDGLDLLDALRVAEIHDEQAGVRRLQRAREPQYLVFGRDGGEVHELKVDALVGHHPRLGILGRERIRRHLGARPRQAGMKRRLARIRRP
jgi:hypothetical protein